MSPVKCFPDVIRNAVVVLALQSMPCSSVCKLLLVATLSPVSALAQGAGGGAMAGRDGFTVGGVLEYLFTQNWSGKIEYQYYDLGTVNFVGPGPIPIAASFQNDQHTIKAGLNYRFNWGAPMGAPLAPGY